MNAENSTHGLITRLMEGNTIAQPEPQGKNPLMSWTVWGGTVLVLLDIGDILTGDPWSLNGILKWAGLLLGGVLVFVGRSRAKEKLNWSALSSWFYNRSQGRAADDPFWDLPSGELGDDER